jgi:hypothetical protein
MIHKAKALTKKEVEDNRSSAYKYLDMDYQFRSVGICSCLIKDNSSSSYCPACDKIK